MGDRPDYSPTVVDVQLRPDWAALNGTDKSLYGEGSAAHGGGINYSYTVPAGKKLYIDNISFFGYAWDPADADLNQICRALVFISGGAKLWSQGGNGGGASSLPKPLVIDPGQMVVIEVDNQSNHVMNIGIYTAGYEADA